MLYVWVDWIRVWDGETWLVLLICFGVFLLILEDEGKL